MEDSDRTNASIFSSESEIFLINIKGLDIKLKIACATLFSLVSLSAHAAGDIEVTIVNNTPKVVTKASASSSSFPGTLQPGESLTFTQPYWSSSSVVATYASGQVTGGCKFEAGHTENANGPVYTSSGTGYGSVSDGFCYVYVSEKWSKPYNYKVRFMISQ